MVKKFKSILAMSHETEMLLSDLQIEEERHETDLETMTNKAT